MSDNLVEQLNKMVKETEFSDRVNDKVKELSVKARLRKESGKKDEECLTPEEMKELIQLIKADMILDGLRAKTSQAYLDEIDKVIKSLEK